MAAIPLGIALAAKGAQAYLSNRSKKKKAKENRRAGTAALNIQQKQREDARRARLQMANSLLGGVPSTTAGGGVNTNVGLDPELVRQLGIERTYDFGSAIPDETQGSTFAFLSGLAGDVADTAGAYGATQGGPWGGAAGALTGQGQQGTGTVSMEDLMKLLGTRRQQPIDFGSPGGDYGDYS